MLLLPNMALSDVVTFECSYPTYASPEGLKEEDFEFTIVYDRAYEKAHLFINGRDAELFVLSGEETLTFMELTDIKNVNTTAVIRLKQDSTKTRTKSVHSRATALLGTFIPSQYYGECEWK